jgi:hypothetical protein
MTASSVPPGLNTTLRGLLIETVDSWESDPLDATEYTTSSLPPALASTSSEPSGLNVTPAEPSVVNGDPATCTNAGAAADALGAAARQHIPTISESSAVRRAFRPERDVQASPAMARSKNRRDDISPP